MHNLRDFYTILLNIAKVINIIFYIELFDLKPNFLNHRIDQIASLIKHRWNNEVRRNISQSTVTASITYYYVRMRVK